MKLHLRDRNAGMIEAWKAVFRDTPDITITQGDIFADDVPSADAIVSPANSFGFMDGGIDLAYSMYFGWDLQDRLQKHLKETHYGILPVGRAVVVPTNHKRFPLLISAPTMTIPMVITGTINAYLAMRAVFVAIQDYHNHVRDRGNIESVLCPGLGTAVGRLPYEVAAAQMFEAYQTIILNKVQKFDDLGDAWNYHERLRRGQI